MKLIKKLIRKRFQENCAFVFILFQIRIYVHLQCLVPGYMNSRQCVFYNQPRTELNFHLCATAPKFL